MKRLSLEQAAKQVLTDHEGMPCPDSCATRMLARAVLEAASLRPKSPSNLTGDYENGQRAMWDAMKRAAKGKP